MQNKFNFDITTFLKIKVLNLVFFISNTAMLLLVFLNKDYPLSETLNNPDFYILFSPFLLMFFLPINMNKKMSAYLLKSISKPNLNLFAYFDKKVLNDNKIMGSLIKKNKFAYAYTAPSLALNIEFALLNTPVDAYILMNSALIRYTPQLLFKKENLSVLCHFFKQSPFVPFFALSQTMENTSKKIEDFTNYDLIHLFNNNLLFFLNERSLYTPEENDEFMKKHLSGLTDDEKTATLNCFKAYVEMLLDEKSIADIPMDKDFFKKFAELNAFKSKTQKEHVAIVASPDVCNDLEGIIW